MHILSIHVSYNKVYLILSFFKVGCILKMIKISFITVLLTEISLNTYFTYFGRTDRGRFVQQQIPTKCQPFNTQNKSTIVVATVLIKSLYLLSALIKKNPNSNKEVYLVPFWSYIYKDAIFKYFMYKNFDRMPPHPTHLLYKKSITN